MRRVLCAALALLLLLTAAAAEPLVRAGGAFCLALDAQGRIWGWGDTSRGQLGTGRGSKVFAPAPAALGLDGTRVKDVACGNINTLFLLEDGTVWTCGGNDYGQQGLGGGSHVREPVPVPGLEDIAQLACGWGQCLARTADGHVYAWGRNNCGQLGDGRRQNASVPFLLPLESITDVQCGGKYCLATDADGDIWGWGDNEYGTLPGVTERVRTTPAKLSVSGRFTAVYAAGQTAFGLDAEGRLWGWGRNDLYQAGSDQAGKLAPEPVPVLLPEGTAVARVLAYNSHTAVLTEDGQLWVWGNLAHGQSGTGRRLTKSLPLDAAPGTAFLDAAVGSTQIAALTEEGEVWCIGGGEYGQTGSGRAAYYVCEWAPTGLHLLESQP